MMSDKRDKPKPWFPCIHANSVAEFSEYFHPGRSFPKSDLKMLLLEGKRPNCIEKATSVKISMYLFLTVSTLNNTVLVGEWASRNNKTLLKC